MEQPRIDDLAKRLVASLPETVHTMRRDIENNFRAVLQSGLSHLDVTTRTEFEVQRKVLERARTQIGQLEARVATLEARLRDLEAAIPPVSD
jgi:ubiquinone biosynthesis accessory factor UbiK